MCGRGFHPEAHNVALVEVHHVDVNIGYLLAYVHNKSCRFNELHNEIASSLLHERYV